LIKFLFIHRQNHEMILCKHSVKVKVLENRWRRRSGSGYQYIFCIHCQGISSITIALIFLITGSNF
ncbi:MAG: hypothetical protein ACKOPK_12380, partial [Dolichospermum sp.]